MPDYRSPEHVHAIYIHSQKPHQEWSTTEWQAALQQWETGPDLLTIIAKYPPERRSEKAQELLAFSIDQETGLIDGYFPYLIHRLCLVSPTMLIEIAKRFTPSENR